MGYLKDKEQEVENKVKNVGRKVKKGFDIFTGRLQVRKIGRDLRGNRSR